MPATPQSQTTVCSPGAAISLVGIYGTYLYRGSAGHGHGKVEDLIADAGSHGATAETRKPREMEAQERARVASDVELTLP